MLLGLKSLTQSILSPFINPDANPTPSPLYSNLPTESYFKPTILKLYLLHSFPLDSDILTIIKHLLFKFETTRTIQPPQHNVTFYKSKYVDPQGIVFKTDRSGIPYVFKNNIETTSLEYTYNHRMVNKITYNTKDGHRIWVNIAESNINEFRLPDNCTNIEYQQVNFPVFLNTVQFDEIDESYFKINYSRYFGNNAAAFIV